MCIALHTQCFPSVCGKNLTGDSGGIRTHDLLLTSADVPTSRPPSLSDDDRPARILASIFLNQLFIIPTQEFHQPMNIAESAAI